MTGFGTVNGRERGDVLSSGCAENLLRVSARPGLVQFYEAAFEAESLLTPLLEVAEHAPRTGEPASRRRPPDAKASHFR